MKKPELVVVSVAKLNSLNLQAYKAAKAAIAKVDTPEKFYNFIRKHPSLKSVFKKG